MATALASLITVRPVRSDVGMTGEITLRGQVLKVGGVKEKILGAHRAGIRTVILPHDNQGDLEDVPVPVRSSMIFAPVERVEQVLALALEPVSSERPAEAASAARPGLESTSIAAQAQPH
jgi:ATP-dependent Lon protease